MCYALYIGTEEPIEETVWEKNHPSFYINGKDGNVQDARKHFTQEHVYYVGSHEKCGCGFFYDGDDDDLEERKESVQHLVSLINQVLSRTAQVELLVTWWGHESWTPWNRLALKPGQLLGDELPLDEGDFVAFTEP